MKCPLCSINLVPADYEGLRVMQCPECGGHLVPQQRLEIIKRAARKSQDDLDAEASSQRQTDSPYTFKCPHCHTSMRKQRADLAGLHIETDLCRHCALVWLDGGELALLQLGYEVTAKFIDSQEFKRRMQELEASPARKAKFEENLARLPDKGGPWKEVFGDCQGPLDNVFRIIEMVIDFLRGR